MYFSVCTAKAILLFEVGREIKTLNNYPEFVAFCSFLKTRSEHSSALFIVCNIIIITIIVIIINTNIIIIIRQ